MSALARIAQSLWVILGHYFCHPFISSSAALCAKPSALVRESEAIVPKRSRVEQSKQLNSVSQQSD